MSESAPTFVPDASVILKWVLDSAAEPGHAAAAQLLGRWRKGEIALAVPPLWVYEVGNVLCLKRPDAAMILTALCALGLREVPLGFGIVERSVALAKANGLTFYDASYLAVAESIGAILVTADRKFYRRLPAGLPVELVT